MSRARGANALLNGGFESVYGGGAAAVSAWLAFPFVSSGGLNEEQALEDSDVLGNGREPQDPIYGPIDLNSTDIVVPVDLRYFPNWLKMMFGAPSTAAGLKATGSGTFSAQPANNATLTLNGTVLTFKTTAAIALDVQIGADISTTVQNLVTAANQSNDTQLLLVFLTQDAANSSKFNIEYQAPGTAGNSYTAVASSSPNSRITLSGATLAGGSAGGGTYNHTFISGASSLPSMVLETGNPDVPSYELAYGLVADKLSLPFSRQGKFNATVSLIGQGSTGGASSSASSPSTLVLTRFTNFTGAIYRDGLALGNIVSGNLTIMNNQDPAQVLRGDGRIAGADPGIAGVDLQLVSKFATRTLLDIASSGQKVEMRLIWQLTTKQKLTIIAHRAFLPKPKIPITGPSGIQATYNLKGSEDPTLLKSLTAIMVNDVASYA